MPEVNPWCFLDFTLCLASWKANEPKGISKSDQFGLHVVAKVVAVQLLASTFTTVQHTSSDYDSPHKHFKDNPTSDRENRGVVISSLKQHTRFQHTPALGHHARNNSAASIGTDAIGTLSREDVLAEQTSHNRLWRRRDWAKVRAISSHWRCSHEACGPKTESTLPMHDHSILGKSSQCSSTQSTSEDSRGVF